VLLRSESQCYGAFGVRIHSRYPLPAQVLADAAWEPGDVAMDFRAIDAPRSSPRGGSRRVWTRHASGASLSFEDAGGYHLRLDYDSGASRIDVRFNRPEEDVSGILLGIGMGALLHLRGVPALHATTLAWRGRAIALAGVAGGGKSSLAAALGAIGLPLLCDDVTPIRFTGDTPLVQSGGHVVRLCADVAARAPELFGAIPGAPGTDAKRALDARALRGGSLAEELPLAAVYVLTGREPGLTAPAARRLPATVACVALTSFVYGSDWLEPARSDVLDLCARLASRVAVMQLALPDGFARLLPSAVAFRDALDTDLD
jgi:hypothetical protein